MEHPRRSCSAAWRSRHATTRRFLRYAAIVVWLFRLPFVPFAVAGRRRCTVRHRRRSVANRHGNGIGFFSGGAARAPDAQGLNPSADFRAGSCGSTCRVKRIQRAGMAEESSIRIDQAVQQMRQAGGILLGGAKAFQPTRRRFQILGSRDNRRHARPARCWDSRAQCRSGARPAGAAPKVRAREWCSSPSSYAYVSSPQIGTSLPHYASPQLAEGRISSQFSVPVLSFEFRSQFLSLGFRSPAAAAAYDLPESRSACCATTFISFSSDEKRCRLRECAASCCEWSRSARASGPTGCPAPAAADRNFPAPR